MWHLSNDDITDIEARAQRTLADPAPVIPGDDAQTQPLRLRHVQALIRDLRELHKLRTSLIALNLQAKYQLDPTPATALEASRARHPSTGIYGPMGEQL
jgi:hypothetical protein